MLDTVLTDSATSLVTRKQSLFYSDISRVITRTSMPGGTDRVLRVCERITQLSPQRAAECYERVRAAFEDRHRDITEEFRRNYYIAMRNLPGGADLDMNQLSPEHRILMGAYFTKEFSIEAAAFFNPSIVPHPDQSGMDDDSSRVLLSFRAVGEGHLSSIVFRSGVVDGNNDLTLDPLSRYVETPEVVRNPNYIKQTFCLKLDEMEVHDEVRDEILDDLPEEFTFKDLEDAIWIYGVHHPERSEHPTINTIKWVAKANYELIFSSDYDVSERVIFPYSDNESSGIEDARFVRFVDDDGEVVYYATYTAFNGTTILPQMLETRDFVRFKIITLNGSAVKNKGMALFPRKLDGQYYMVGRIDGENLYLMNSENLHFWHQAKLLVRPRYDWDLITIGNCGSPIETSEGWLLLTHGVGPMRTYSLGAVLLDLEDPSIVRAYMKKPLMVAEGKEREGYVPNVVYTCGYMRHNDSVLLPYAMSDTVAGFAVVDLEGLLNRLLDDAD